MKRFSFALLGFLAALLIAPTLADVYRYQGVEVRNLRAVVNQHATNLDQHATRIDELIADVAELDSAVEAGSTSTATMQSAGESATSGAHTLAD